MSLAKLQKLPALDGVSQDGLAQIEKDRLARIKFIQETMQRMMAGVDTSLLQKQQRVPKNKSPGRPLKRKTPASEGEPRRSSRISNLPVPLYYVVEDPTESVQKQRRLGSTTGKVGPAGHRCHGTASAAAGGDDPYLWAPPGWKVECGSASLAAADAAIAAAAELVKQRRDQNGHAFVKLMSSSQVSGGFWCQLPSDILLHYGEAVGADKRVILLHCDDKADQGPSSFRYSLAGSSSKWCVVYLPKSDGGGTGLSGGWRGFAIDMRLNPNDTVVFEVVDNADPSVAMTQSEVAAAASAAQRLKKPASTDAEHAWVAAATAGAKDSSSTAGLLSRSTSAAVTAVCDGESANEREEQAAAGAATAGEAVTPSVFVNCKLRLHMRVHIFRAANYETGETRAGANPRHELAAMETPQQAAPAPATWGGGSEGSGSQHVDQEPRQQCQYHSVIAADEHDVSRAKRTKLASPAAAGRSGGDNAAAQRNQERGQQQQQQQQQQQCTTSSTGFGALHNKVLTPKGSGCSVLQSGQPCLPPSSPAAVQQLGFMEAAVVGRLPVKVGYQTGSPAVAAAAAASPLPAVAAALEPRQKRASAAAASSAWSSAAAPATKKSRVGVKLVAKPVNPAELVPGPTRDELSRNRAGGVFEVERILEHRCNPAAGQGEHDEFLVRWRGFSPYWDSWEPLSSLMDPPASYKWEGGSKAIPDKFRL